jgi:CBS domain-containing protein
MGNTRRDSDSYTEWSNRDFAEERYRNRAYEEDDRRTNRNRNFANRTDNIDRASAASDAEYYGNFEERVYGLDYPDCYSAGQGYVNEAYYRQGSKRSHLRCRDLMTRQVTTCNKNTRLQDIARLMREEDIGALPVLDEKGKLEGIVTDRDLIIKGLTSTKPDLDLRAEDCMSTDLFTANMNDRVVDVLRDMGDNQVRRVPVIDNRDRLVGIIAMADVATQTSRDRELEATLKEISKPSSFFGRLAYYLGL